MSILSTAFCHHLLTLISHRSFATSSNHLNLGLPILLLPSSLLLKYFHNYPSMIHSYQCPIHSNLFFVMCATLSKSSCSSRNSWLVLILHIPCSTTGLFILLNIFLSHIFSLFISISVMGHVSLPYTTTGFTIVLYILILTTLLTAQHLNICHTL